MPIDLNKLPDKEGPEVDLSGLPDREQIDWTPPKGLEGLWDLRENAERDSFAKKLMKDEWQNAKDVGNLYPVAEMAASIITNLYGLPISGLVGIGGMVPSLIMDKDLMTPAMKFAQDMLIYQPQTEAGRRLTERGFYPFELLEKIGGKAGDKVLDITGSPGWATATKTIIEAAPALAMLKVLKPGIIRGLQNSTTWRRMTIKERGLVVQSLEETARKNPRLSEAELLRNSKQYFKEAIKRDAEAAERLRAMQEAERPAKEAPKEGAKETPTPAKVFDEVLESIRKDQPERVGLTEADIRIPIPKEPIKPEAITEYEQLAGEAARRAFENIEKHYKAEEVKIWKEAKKMAPAFVEEDPVFAKQTEIVEAGGINRQSMIDNDVTPADIADLNRKRPRLITKEGTLAVDVVAGEMGYDTADAMVQDWKQRPTKKVMTKKITEQLADEMLIGLDYQKDVEFNTLVAEEEVKILSKILNKKPKVRRDLKKIINEQTGVRKIGEIVSVDARKALKDAIRARARIAREAFRAGKTEAALKAKEQQLTRLDKLRATMEARKVLNQTKAELKRAKKKVKKMSRAPQRNIKALLEALDPVKLSKKKRLQLEKTRDFIEDNPEVEISKRVWESIARLDKKPLADFTINELKDIRNYILHQNKVDRTTKKIKRKRREQFINEVVAGAIDSMVPPNKNSLLKSLPPGKFEKARRSRRIKNIFGLGQDGYDLMIESIGGKESVIWDILADDLFEARNLQLKTIDNALTAYGEAAEAIYKKHKIKKPEKWLAEVVKTGKHEFTRAERIELYRHSLNEDNRTAIIEGGYGKRFSDNPFKVENITKEELNAIIKDLSPAEKALAEEPMAEFFDYFGKKMADVFYEKNGYPLELMPPEEYYPKQVMSTARIDAMDIEKENAVEKFRNTGFTRIGVDRSNTIERVGSKKPIYINPFWYTMVRFSHRNATYVAYEMPLTNASRIMRDPKFKTEMLDRYPPELYFEIQKGLRDIAGEYISYDILEEGLMRLKNNVSVATLGGPNFKVMGRQLFSFPMYLMYMKPRHLVGGILDNVFHPRRTHKMHLEMSPKYKERVEGGFSRDLHDVFKDKNWRKILGKRHISLKNAYMRGVLAMDKTAVKRGMRGAVRQVLSDIRKGKFSREVKYHLKVDDSIIPKLDAGQKLELAYKYADTATAESQPMFLPEYWSSLQRGGPGAKLFTMFGSFTNRALGQFRRTYRGYKRAKTAADKAYWAGKMLKVWFWLGIFNATAMTMWDYLWHKFAGGEDEKFNWWVRTVGWPLGYWFIIRDISYALQTHIEKGGFQGADPSIPIQQLGASAVDALYSVVVAGTTDDPELAKEHTMRFLNKVLETYLTSRGVPYRPTKRLIDSIIRED